MKGFAIIAVWLVVTVPVAQADCGATEKTLFSCLTKKGKQVEICNFGRTIRYSFGRPNDKPEISVVVPTKSVTGTSCYACGRYISNLVDISNGNVMYRVSWSGDKLDTDSPLEGGVEVFVNGESKAFIPCASEPTTNNTEGIEFKEPVVGN